MNTITLTTIIILITVIIFVCLAKLEINSGINYHEKLNPDLYMTPEIDKIDLADENIKKGYLRAKNSKIVICSLVRNNSSVVDKTKIRFEYIGSYFKDYKIVLFENDSSDNTRELISKWSDDNKNVILLNCCDMGSCDCKLKNKTGYTYGSYSSQRLARMALYRQQYLNFVNKNFADYDYMLVVDFDLDGNCDIYGLFDSIAKDDWGAIFCNGRAPIPGCFGAVTLVYDSLAFLSNTSNYDDINFSIADIFYNTAYMELLINTTHFGEVKSAFNGYGIYKINVLKNCSYVGNDKICEHINLAKCINNKGEKLFLNSNWLGYFNRQGDDPYKLFVQLLS